jgi:hypothetical protein
VSSELSGAQAPKEHLVHVLLLTTAHSVGPLTPGAALAIIFTVALGALVGALRSK